MTTINFRTAQFLTSAQSIEQCPPERGIEVAFAGRSNAGKSSAINKLTQNKNLCRTSKTPGRTQLINFFKLHDSPDLKLVDLPGYGYAKVAQSVKEKWQEHLSRYLHERQCLKGLILLMDIRHPMQDSDTMMLDWAVQSEMPVHALLTKCDKLKGGAAKVTLREFNKEIENAGLDGLVSAQLFSAQSGTGVDELARLLNTWLQPEKN